MAKLIVKQQDMSMETLAQLRLRGVVDDVTKIRIEFFYEAPSQEAAKRLATFLYEATDYDVEASRARSGIRRVWQVKGRTQEAVVSTDILNQWIRWMVLAGSEHGECRFDGWGATVPV